MIDPIEKLEAEMRAMRPRKFGEQLERAVESSVVIRPWGDWILMGAMGAGVAAAGVIALMLTIGGASPPGISTQPISPGGTSAGSYLQTLARADDGELLGLK